MGRKCARYLLLGNLRRVERLVEGLERDGHRARQAVDDDVVDELHVRAPCGRALGHLGQ